MELSGGEGVMIRGSSEEGVMKGQSYEEGLRDA